VETNSADDGDTIGGGMEIQTSEARREMHWLLDHIPEADVPTARKFLRALADPVALSLLNAPLDDEPETEAEHAAVEAAKREAGRGAAHDDVLREFGL
jgi:hypothetical protein